MTTEPEPFEPVSPEAAAPRAFPVGVALGVLALTLVIALGLVLGAGSATLLTPPPAIGAPLTFIAGMVLGIGLAMVVTAPLPRGLVRRLIALSVMACTLYSTGQAMRGLYAAWAFSGENERGELQLSVTGAGGGALRAVDPSRGSRVLVIPAVDDLSLDWPRGQCVTVPIERSADGDERIAADIEPLTGRSIHDCD